MATYRGVARATDIEVEAQAAAAKETIVLRSRRAPLHVRLSDGPRRTDRQAPRRMQVLLSDAEGMVHATIPAGYMTDAKGATSSKVTYRLDGDVLRVGADRRWVADSDREFPVRVDPTVLTPKKMKASTAMTVYSGGAYNGASDFEVGGASNRRTYLKWDVSSLTNHRIFGANLSVVNYDSTSCTPREVAVHDVTDGWSLNPSGYSLANAPSLGRKLDSARFAYGYVPYNSSTSPCRPQGSLFELGASGRNTVQGWVNGGGNNGLAITAPGGAWKKFAGPSTANAPTLYVTHTPYDAKYKIANPTPSPIVMQNRSISLKVTVTNESTPWRRQPTTTQLSYQVFNSQGQGLRRSRTASTPAPCRPWRVAPPPRSPRPSRQFVPACTSSTLP